MFRGRIKGTTVGYALIWLTLFGIAQYQAIMIGKARDTAEFRPFTIVKKNCHSGKSHSNVKITYEKGIEYITVGDNECGRLQLGDTISVFYSEEYDLFFEEGDKKGYQWIAIGALLALVLGLIPMKKIGQLFSRSRV